MDEFTTILSIFETCLKRFNRPAFEKLRSGLEQTSLATLLGQLNISDENLTRLYRWSDGIKHEPAGYVGNNDFFSFGKMLPLEDAVVFYRKNVDQGLWREGLFPVFTTYAGDYLLLDWVKESDDYGVLYLYAPDLLIVTPEPAYRSLQTLFKTIVECYEQGAYSLAQNGNLTIDYELERKISQGINKSIAYWED